MSDKPESQRLLILDRLLAFMSAPWKAVVIVVLTIICGAGYLIYLERGTIADAILHRAHDTAELDSAAFLRDSDKLLRDTRADYALLRTASGR